jgi:hypothetical protein
MKKVSNARVEIERPIPLFLSWSNGLSFLLICISAAFFLGICIGTAWYARVRNEPALTDLIILCLTVFGILLIGANVLIAALNRARGLQHVFMVALLIASTVIAYWGNCTHIDNRRRWFASVGRLECEHAVEQVLTNRTGLSDQPRILSEIHVDQTVISAKTNKDGSIIVRFAGGEGGPRHGYLYQSVGSLQFPTERPDAIVHLTNNWYEY